MLQKITYTAQQERRVITCKILMNEHCL